MLKDSEQAQDDAKAATDDISFMQWIVLAEKARRLDDSHALSIRS